MRAKITYFVTGRRPGRLLRPGRQPRRDADPAGHRVTVTFGVAVLVLPVIGIWFLWQNTRSPAGPNGSPRELEAEGGLPSTSWSARPAAGSTATRPTRSSPSARPRRRTPPDDWRCWFRLAVAYHDARDTPRARKAMQHAIALHDGGGRAGRRSDTRRGRSALSGPVRPLTRCPAQRAPRTRRPRPRPCPRPGRTPRRAPRKSALWSVEQRSARLRRAGPRVRGPAPAPAPCAAARATAPAAGPSAPRRSRSRAPCRAEEAHPAHPVRAHPGAHAQQPQGAHDDDQRDAEHDRGPDVPRRRR